MRCMKRGLAWRLVIACFAFVVVLAMPAKAFAAPEHWVTDVNGNSLDGASIDVSVLEQGIIFNDIWVLGDRHGGGWMQPIVTDLGTGAVLPHVGYQSLGMTPVGDEIDPVSGEAVTHHLTSLHIYSGFIPGHSYQIALCFKENSSAAGEYDYITFGSGADSGDGTDGGSEGDTDSGDGSGDDSDSGGGSDDSGTDSGSDSDAGTDTADSNDGGNANQNDESSASGGTSSAKQSETEGLSAKDSSNVGDFGLTTAAQNDSDADSSQTAASSAVGATPLFDGKSLASFGQMFKIASGASENSDGGSGSESSVSASVEVTGIAWLWTLLWLTIALALPMGVAARALRFGRGIGKKSRLQTQ